MTNDEISKKLGYGRPNIISMWKAGKTRVTLDVIWRLSDLLQVDVAYLLALYFEQHAGSSNNGADHFEDIVRMMRRVCTPWEFEVIKTVRRARRYNDGVLGTNQRWVLTELFTAPITTPIGPLKPIHLKFGRATSRGRLAGRGFSRDKRITPTGEARVRVLDGRRADTSLSPEGDDPADVAGGV
jgi:transcriptional regulator with XRE-family HTH domain